MNDNPEHKQMKLEIQVDESVAPGQYVNMVVAQHSSSEFVLDFIFIAPGQPKAKVRSRVILAPEHAKRLQRALSENIGNYERRFGEIALPETPFIPGATTKLQ